MKPRLQEHVPESPSKIIARLERESKENKEAIVLQQKALATLMQQQQGEARTSACHLAAFDRLMLLRFIQPRHCSHYNCVLPRRKSIAL